MHIDINLLMVLFLNFLKTHWHQSCAIFKEQKLIKSGKQVSLKAVMNRGNLHIVGIDDT